MSCVGVAHNFAPKFDYDTRTTTGAKYFPRTVFESLLEEYHRYIRKRNYERNAKLKRDKKLHCVCIQKRIYQRQRVCFVVWCEQVKQPRFSVLELWKIWIDELTKAECNAEFRFYKNDIYKLADAVQLADEFVTYNGLIVESIPALCIYLKRFSYPCRYSDMVSHFARPVPEICIVTNHIIDWIYNRWNYLLTTYNHSPLSPANLMLYADAIHQSGAA